MNGEGRIPKQMDDHSSEIFGAIENETSAREQISQGLQTRIQTNEQQMEQSQQELESKIRHNARIAFVNCS